MVEMFQYRKRYEVTCDVVNSFMFTKKGTCFNTASGMRSHVTNLLTISKMRCTRFNTASGMRSHVTDSIELYTNAQDGFNTASGMRSHVTMSRFATTRRGLSFQYRKRYEVTCDSQGGHAQRGASRRVSIPQAV